MKFQTSISSMLVGMSWLWSCWLDRPCITLEFQAKIWGKWSIQLVFLKLDPFSLNHFSDPIYACITKSSILALSQGAKMYPQNLFNFLYCVPFTVITLNHLAFVNFLNKIDTRKIEILTFGPFSRGQNVWSKSVRFFKLCLCHWFTPLYLWHC